MKIVHVIIGLDIGGAELMLKRLTERTSENWDTTIISLTDNGILGPKLKEKGVVVKTLGISSARDFPRAFLDLRLLFKELRPDIVQTWMYHSDFLGGLAAKSVGVKNIVWNVRNTTVDGRGFYNFLFRKFCALLSHFLPKKIVYVSHSARLEHVRIGYNDFKSMVIGNGFDMDEFVYDCHGRDLLRKHWSLKDDDLIVCSVGRYVREKDHSTFIKSIKLLVESGVKLKAVMIGKDIDYTNGTLAQGIKGFEEHFLLLGPRSDVPSILSFSDIFCLHSITEGFPNVLGEAMSVGLPCITTKAGDAERILNNPAFTVEVGDYKMLAEKILELSKLSRQERVTIGEANRDRVKADYSLGSIVSQYQELYSDIS